MNAKIASAIIKWKSCSLHAPTFFAFDPRIEKQEERLLSVKEKMHALFDQGYIFPISFFPDKFISKTFLLVNGHIFRLLSTAIVSCNQKQSESIKLERNKIALFYNKS